MKPLLNQKQVATLLNVSQATVSRLVKAGGIPYIFITGGTRKQTVRFVEEQVERWITKRSRGGDRGRGRIRNRATLVGEMVDTESEESKSMNGKGNLDADRFERPAEGV